MVEVGHEEGTCGVGEGKKIERIVFYIISGSGG
jgi:hypothetical protein